MKRFLEFLRRIFRRRRKAATPISVTVTTEGFEECSESLREAARATKAIAMSLEEVSPATNPEEVSPAIGPSRQLALAGESFAEGFTRGVISAMRKCDRIQAALPMPRICAMLIAIEASPADIHRLSTSKKTRLRKKIYHKTLRRIRIKAKKEEFP